VLVEAHNDSADIRIRLEGVLDQGLKRALHNIRTHAFMLDLNSVQLFGYSGTADNEDLLVEVQLLEILGCQVRS
jgi:hypothetical protein